MSQVKVSIILPNFNTEEFIKEAIESVINQTFTSWNLIIIDDCSTDNSFEIAKSYEQKDSRIKVFKNDKNLGVAETRNRGILLTNSEWIAFLDSDDLWSKDKLSLQIDLAQKTNSNFIYGNYQFIDECGASRKVIFCPNRINYKDLLKGSDIACLTVLVKACILKKYKFQNQFHEDYLLWLDILKTEHLTAYGVPEILGKYRRRPNSRSAKKFLCAKAQWDIYRKYLELSFHKSFYYFVHYAFKGISKHWIK